ncbi:MAG: cytochrome c [Gemmatimonadaceae bacterium]
MKHRLLALVPVLAIVLGGCEWFSDFKDQPRVEPWEKEMTMRDSAGHHVSNETTPFRGNPQMSVPTTGMAVSGFQVSYTAGIGQIDSMAATPNPAPVSAASLDNGRKYYQINCAVCHGANGGAQTMIVSVYHLPAPSLLLAPTVARSDGYIFGMIRNGRGLMPTYDRIEERDRWDVVNYVRSLQGRTGAAADTTHAGYPGQNGATVPSYSTSAPQRPSPWYGPHSNSRVGMPEVPGPSMQPIPADSVRSGPAPARARTDSAARRTP